MMGTQSTIGPFRARPLRPVLSVGPEEVSIFSGHLSPTEVHRSTIGNESNGRAHGIISRSAVSTNGQIVATGGWPAPIRRTASFAVIPRPSKPVNVIVGVPSTPGNSRYPRGRRNSIRG